MSKTLLSFCHGSFAFPPGRGDFLRHCSPSTTFSTRCSMEGFTHTRPCTLLSEGQHCMRSICVIAWDVLTDWEGPCSVCYWCLHPYPGLTVVQPKFSPWVGIAVQVLAVTERLNDLGMMCPSPAEGKLRFWSAHLPPQGAC